jgi:hypothetical protein
LQEPLGLEVEPARGLVEVLVIDSVEQPTSDEACLGCWSLIRRRLFDVIDHEDVDGAALRVQREP